MSNKNIISILLILVFFTYICDAETIKLYTDTTNSGDSNWDVWQQDQLEAVREDAIYLGMFDGASRKIHADGIKADTTAGNGHTALARSDARRFQTAFPRFAIQLQGGGHFAAAHIRADQENPAIVKA